MTNRVPRSAVADTAEAWALLDARATRCRQSCDTAGQAWAELEDAVGFRQGARALALLERATAVVRDDLAGRIAAAPPQNRGWMSAIVRRAADVTTTLNPASPGGGAENGAPT